MKCVLLLTVEIILTGGHFEIISGKLNIGVYTGGNYAQKYMIKFIIINLYFLLASSYR